MPPLLLLVGKPVLVVLVQTAGIEMMYLMVLVVAPVVMAAALVDTMDFVVHVDLVELESAIFWFGPVPCC